MPARVRAQPVEGGPVPEQVLPVAPGPHHPLERVEAGPEGAAAPPAGAGPAAVWAALSAATTKGVVASSRTANNHLLFTDY